MNELLLLRSYGDFVVALNALQQSHHPSFAITASAHLASLYEALAETLPHNSVPAINFKDWGIDKGLLRVFTNKHVFSYRTLQEIRALQAYISEQPVQFWVEQYRRKKILSFFVGKAVSPIHTSGNIYQSYAHFFSAVYPSIEKRVNNNNYFLFPDSRLRKKQIPEHIIEALQAWAKAEGIHIIVWRFQQQYHNFKDLCKAIQEAAFVISADSLPAHVAQYMGTPHGILYANSINEEWITPYAKKNATAACFTGYSKLLERAKQLNLIN
ncbi:MAG: hypothetical protein K2X37_14195 [Chitinophagaceae bacterium]|nr:hypothetical protein [Chitinophagaceae bacterium]